MHNHRPIYLVFYNFFVRYPCPGNSWPPAQALDCRTFVFWSCSRCLCICSSCPKNSTRRLCSRVHCIFLTSPCHPGTSCPPAPCLRIVGTSSWCHARNPYCSCPKGPMDSTRHLCLKMMGNGFTHKQYIPIHTVIDICTLPLALAFRPVAVSIAHFCIATTIIAGVSIVPSTIDTCCNIKDKNICTYLKIYVHTKKYLYIQFLVLNTNINGML